MAPLWTRLPPAYNLLPCSYLRITITPKDGLKGFSSSIPAISRREGIKSSHREKTPMAIVRECKVSRRPSPAMSCQLGSKCDSCQLVIRHVNGLTEAGGIAGVELRWLTIGAVEQGNGCRYASAWRARTLTPSRVAINATNPCWPEARQTPDKWRRAAKPDSSRPSNAGR